MKKQIILITIFALTGCTGDRSSIETHQQTVRIDQDVVASYKQTNSAKEEYVNRVAKRVIMVSDRPDNNYNIEILDTHEPVLQIDSETHTVAISEGVLHNLRDEAELAAALTLGMARLDNSPNIDKETAVYLSRAGYDPHAMLDLQEQYFSFSQNGKQHWLQELYPTPPSAGTIAANRMMIQKMPQGLLRGSESYQQKVLNEQK